MGRERGRAFDSGVLLEEALGDAGRGWGNRWR